MQGQLTADRACANNNIDMESVPGDRHWLYVLPGRGCPTTLWMSGRGNWNVLEGKRPKGNVSTSGSLKTRTQIGRGHTLTRAKQVVTAGMVLTIGPAYKQAYIQRLDSQWLSAIRCRKHYPCDTFYFKKVSCREQIAHQHLWSTLKKFVDHYASFGL